MNNYEKAQCIGKGNSPSQKKIQTVMNIMKYYPFIELGMAIESVKYEVEKSKREREEEYYKKYPYKGRGRSD